MLQFWEHGTRIIVFKTCSRDAIRVRALGAILLFFCLFLDIYHEKGKFLWLRTLSLSLPEMVLKSKLSTSPWFFYFMKMIHLNCRPQFLEFSDISFHGFHCELTMVEGFVIILRILKVPVHFWVFLIGIIKKRTQPLLFSN